MKTYGQDVTDLLVFANDLTVECDNPDTVQFSIYGGCDSFLTVQDIIDLIQQLTEWLATGNLKDKK